MKIYEGKESDMPLNHHQKKMPKHLSRAFHLEAERCEGGTMLMIISGGKGVLRYTKEELTLDIGNVCLRIEGAGLLCRSFSSGVIELKGEVSALAFLTKGEENVKAFDFD